MIQLKPEQFADHTRPWPAAEYEAWRTEWQEDDRIMAETPPGYWFDLVNISRVKRLLMGQMPDDVRLQFLEWLNEKVIHEGLTPVVTLAVKPMCDAGERMMRELDKLHLSDKCAVMRKWNVMAAHCNLNPSLIDAMKLLKRRP
ncbi:hypothetical protein [Bradyrhizobium sp. RT7b]|uniref:hypothetical protein n=1 Tax=unclassified Bradyrhizobium TaxID=2631580 RepID=UPI003393DFF5